MSQRIRLLLSLVAASAALLVVKTARADYCAVYHYNCSSGHDDFYTIDWNEIGNGAYGYSLVSPSDPSNIYDGAAAVLGFASNSSSGSYKIPVYSYLNSGRHMYTSNYSRYGSGSQGWNYEKIRFYAWALVNPTPYSMYDIYRYVHPSDGRFCYSIYNNQATGGWSLDDYLGDNAMDFSLLYADYSAWGTSYPWSTVSE